MLASKVLNKANSYNSGSYKCNNVEFCVNERLLFNSLFVTFKLPVKACVSSIQRLLSAMAFFGAILRSVFCIKWSSHNEMQFFNYTWTNNVPLKFITIKKVTVLLFSVLCLLTEASQAKCTGKFVNPITDVCWECLFPISIGSIELIKGSNPDTDNPSSPICACGTPFPRIGISAGFWEPVRLVDVTKRPFCFVNLGGVEFDPGISIGKGNSPRSTGRAVGSWHVHWYNYPLIYWLELVVDFLCLEQTSFDIAYITELDPLWGDDTLTFILNPEAVLFGNPIAQAACAADCVASSTSLPLDSLFWCGGCQGSMYPLSGNIQGHVGSIQSALMATERMAYKLHRELIAWGTSGKEGLCQKYPMPVMKKSQYRSQLTVPIPSDCYPFGRSTTIYESGKEIPIVGEDFGFLIWRKRNCCVL